MVYDPRPASHSGCGPLLKIRVLIRSRGRFNIGDSGQQIHINCGPTDPEHSRHPCFKLESREHLETLKKAIYDHHVRGGPAAPMAADKPGEVDSGRETVHTPCLLIEYYEYLR